MGAVQGPPSAVNQRKKHHIPLIATIKKTGQLPNHRTLEHFIDYIKLK